MQAVLQTPSSPSDSWKNIALRLCESVYGTTSTTRNDQKLFHHSNINCTLFSPTLRTWECWKSWLSFDFDDVGKKLDKPFLCLVDDVSSCSPRQMSQKWIGRKSFPAPTWNPKQGKWHSVNKIVPNTMCYNHSSTGVPLPLQDNKQEKVKVTSNFWTQH